jgi:enoyl-[acyl-carrier protein] reductase III
MVKEFTDKNEWALILGASSGMGLATARKLAQHGLNLCLVYRTRKLDLESIESDFQKIKNDNGVQVIHFNLDATRPEKREEVISALGFQSEYSRIKVLVHSIAKGNLKPMVSADRPTLKNDDFHLTLENMAFSLYDWVQAIFKKNLFAKDARIISFTSMGNRRAWENYAAVSTAKVALEAITRNIAFEFAAFGIKANCIEAGITDTSSFRMIPGHEKLKEFASSQNPSGRMTSPEDVANVVYLLCKEEAKWITGTIIPVNGGEHLR